jgi:FlaG/FlaF family flagellin (archaellin)
MKPEKIFKNNEAVSISVGFILMFAITVIIFSALIVSFYALTHQSEKSAMRESFKTIGSGLASKLTTVDVLVNVTNNYNGTVNTLEYSFSLPASIAAKSYTVNVTNSTYEIILESDNGARIVVPFNIYTNLTGRTIYSGSGDYLLKYDKASNSMVIQEQ